MEMRATLEGIVYPNTEIVIYSRITTTDSDVITKDGSRFPRMAVDFSMHGTPRRVED